MKEILLSIVVTSILVGCASREETVNFRNQNKIHFTSNSSIRPVSMIQYDDQYRLYYTKSDSLFYTVSNNLLHWRQPGVPAGLTNSISSIVLDSNNSTGLGSLQDPPIIFLYDDGRLFYTLRGVSEKREIQSQLPTELIGILNLYLDPLDNEWVMTAHSANQAIVFTSPDLSSWNKLKELELSNTSEYTSMIRDEEEWILLESGATSNITVLNHDFNVKLSAEPILLSSGKSFITAQLDNEIHIIANMDDYSIGIPRILEVSDGSSSQRFTANLDFLATTKRRSKLSSLKGKGASRFQFPIGDVQAELTVNIFNEQGESLLLTFSKVDQRLTVDKIRSSNAQEGNVTQIPWTSNLGGSVDLVIDYSSIEVSFSEGKDFFAIPTNPIFIYDQVMLTKDDEPIDPRAILFSLSEGINGNQ